MKLFTASPRIRVTCRIVFILFSGSLLGACNLPFTQSSSGVHLPTTLGAQAPSRFTYPSNAFMGIATNGFPISGAIHNDSISNPASVNTFPSSAQFLTNSSTLSPGARIQLLKFIKLVSERDPQAAIEVIGHTDSYGPLSSNLTLSRERASSVRNFLVTHGLGANPISTIGVGPNQPLVPDKTPAGVWIPANMAKNRRVDIKLLS